MNLLYGYWGKSLLIITLEPIFIGDSLVSKSRWMSRVHFVFGFYMLTRSPKKARRRLSVILKISYSFYKLADREKFILWDNFLLILTPRIYKLLPFLCKQLWYVMLVCVWKEKERVYRVFISVRINFQEMFTNSSSRYTCEGLPTKIAFISSFLIFLGGGSKTENF